MIIGCVGNITPSFKKYINNSVQKIKKIGDKVTFRTKVAKKQFINTTKTNKVRLIAHLNDSQQVQAVVGFPAFSIFDRRRYVMRLLASILTNGHNTRLFQKIREQKGLVYYLDSFSVEFTNTGYFAIKLSCTKENILAILKIVKKELEMLATEKIKKAELIRAKKIFKSETIFLLEDPEVLSEYLTEEWIFKKKNADIKQVFSAIDAISVKDIQTVVFQIFAKHRIYLALIGNISSREIERIKRLFSMKKGSIFAG